MSLPLRVFLDTNIFSGAPRRDSAAFRSLERLAVAGEVEIHVSSVAVREFVTQEESHLDRVINELERSLRDLRRRLPDGRPSPALDRAEAVPVEVRSELGPIARTGLPYWISSVQGRVHEPAPAHTGRVLDSYFEGAPPFKQKKNRADFPDAFIFETLRDTVPKPVHAVIADEALRECAARLPDVVAYQSLDGFIQSPVVQERIRTVTISENVDAIATFLRTEHQALEKAVREQLVDAVAGREIHSLEIPDDNNTATISSVGEAEDVHFDLDKAEYYGEGTIRIPFTAVVEVNAEYFIFKADYYCLDEEHARRISTVEWSDHYFAAQEYAEVSVEGALTISIDVASLTSGMDETQIEDALAKARIGIDEIEDISIVCY